MEPMKNEASSRLIDYLTIVGTKHPNGKPRQNPELICRCVVCCKFEVKRS